MGLEKEVDSLTGPEMEVVTVVFHQFETGLREGTIYTRVRCIPFKLATEFR
jgi:hypothetical protein